MATVGVKELNICC